MRGEVVDRDLDGCSLAQHVEVTDEQLALERIRMIEVDLVPLLRVQTLEAAVIRIMRNPLDAMRADPVVDRLGDCRFSRSGPAGDADDDRLHQFAGQASCSNSASVTKSAGSSAPHVLQTTVARRPLRY